MKETEGIIFDYGGTLDSRGDHWSEVIWRAYVSERAEVTREAFREAYVHAERALDRDKSIGPQDTFRDVMRKKIGLQLDYLDIYTPELHEAIGRRCYDSARECVAESAVTLRRLAEKYPLAIVSNFYGNLRAVLADFGVSHLFRAVIDSGETGIRKPDPEIFRAGLRALGITDPGKVLVVGDSVDKDILPAHSLGCRTALLPGVPWDASRPAPQLPKETAILQSLSNLAEIHIEF